MMDLYAFSREYVSKLLGPSGVPVRVLLLDGHTTPLISLVSTQSELLKQDVYLVDRLESTRDKLRTLGALIFCSVESLDLLVAEIGSPKYKEYRVVFNGVVSKSALERLAEADDFGVIKEVWECYLSYGVLNSLLFVPEIVDLNIREGSGWEKHHLDHSVKSIVAVSLSAKVKPTICWENTKLNEKLSQALSYEFKNQTFDGFSGGSLIILDRRNDPVTPLLFPWTYQSMVHDVIGIDSSSNTVKLGYLNVSNELETVVLNSSEDSFWNDTMYLNFGDLSTKLKEYVEDYKNKTKTNSNINSIKDMKFFLENYPQFKKLSLGLSKHMLLSGEIDKRINRDKIWDISEFQQHLCSNTDQSGFIHDLETINGIKGSNLFTSTACLFALKYEGHSELITAINSWPCADLIKKCIRIYGKQSRSGSISLFNHNNGQQEGNWLQQMTKKQHEGNVFMQTKPRLAVILENLKQGKLDGFKGSISNKNKIILYMVGGVTYEEVRIVEEFRKKEKMDVVIGSTSIINTDMFINELKEL
ncbi:Vps45 protein [Martiniozyma asiatica (nom. inval.)]|nr:Vps45 protein [Martiniozyma asiatica]